MNTTKPMARICSEIKIFSLWALAAKLPNFVVTYGVADAKRLLRRRQGYVYDVSASKRSNH